MVKRLRPPSVFGLIGLLFDTLVSGAVRWVLRAPDSTLSRRGGPGPGETGQEHTLHFPSRKGRKGGSAPSGHLCLMRLGVGGPDFTRPVVRHREGEDCSLPVTQRVLPRDEGAERWVLLP